MVQSRFTSFLIVSLALVASCDEKIPGPAADPLNAQSATPGSKAPSQPPPPPPDFLEASRFSPELYAEILQRLFPIDRELQKASSAFLETRLAAIEIDFWDDDVLNRDGAVVLLGESQNKIIGLTQRYYTDIRYPTIKLIPDGIGGAEIGNQYLTVFDDRRKCKGKLKEKDPACHKQQFKIVKYQPELSTAPDQVQAQTFDDHDITLLHFHRHAPIISERESMGIERPAQIVASHIRKASSFYGFEFTLVSRMAFQDMRDAIKVESIGEQLLLSAASMALGPLIGKLTETISFPDLVKKKMQEKATALVKEKVASAGILLADALESASLPPQDHQVDRIATYFPRDVKTKATLLNPALSPEGCLALKTANQGLTVCLMGTSRPEAGAQTEALASYLEKIAATAEITLANFGEPSEGERGMAFIPIEQVNLNYEILRHGFVKLDVGDAKSLQAFPELAKAAHAALDAGTGFARDWKNDDEYLAQVRHAAML